MNNNKRLHCLYDSLNIAIIVISRETGNFSFANKKVYEALAIPEGSLKNKNYREAFSPEFFQVYLALVTQCADGKEHTTVFYWAEKLVWIQISAKMIDWECEHDSIMLNFTNIVDVTQAQAKEEQIVYFDNITGLPNGKKLENDLNDLVCSEQVSLVYVQLTNIENIHDFHGWDIGDKLLIMIKDWFLETSKQRVQYYRGDEGFIILCREVKPDICIARMREIDRVFSRPWIVQGPDTEHLIYCKVEIGAVFGKYVKNEMRNLLLRMMRSEAPGNFPFRIYNEEIDKSVKRAHRLKNSLTQAVLKNMEGFSVHFQPIVEANTAQWVGLEALCRWRTPQGRTIAPLEFIPLIEKLGFIEKMDNWVRRQAMLHCRDLDLHRKQMFLDVNFSPNQTLDEEFAEALFNAAQETGFPVEHLTLEVTESERMRFNDTTLEGFKVLKNKGLNFSIDDFGSGYSSIENLIKIAATTIKTDKMIIDNLETDIDRQYLIQTLINIAHHLDMRMIVEGVETPGQRQLLEEFGVDYMQGYLFSRPLSFERLAKKTQCFADA